MGTGTAPKVEGKSRGYCFVSNVQKRHMQWGYFNRELKEMKEQLSSTPSLIKSDEFISK